MADGLLEGVGGSPADPKARRKRMMLALGAAAVLALIFLLQRRSGDVEEEPAAPAYAEAPAGSLGVPPFGSSYADNGEAAAALGTSITEGLADVNSALFAQADEFSNLASALQDQDDTPATAPGPLGAVNVNINGRNSRRKPKAPKRGRGRRPSTPGRGRRNPPKPRGQRRGERRPSTPPRGQRRPDRNRRGPRRPGRPPPGPRKPNKPPRRRRRR